MVSYKFIILLFISGKFTTVLSLRNLAELTLANNDTHQVLQSADQHTEVKGPDSNLKTQKPLEGQENQLEQQQQESQVQEQQQQESQVQEVNDRVADPAKGDLSEKKQEKELELPPKENQEHTVSDQGEHSTEGTKKQTTQESKEVKNALPEREGDLVSQNAKRTEGSDGHTEEASVEAGGSGGGGKAGKPEPGSVIQPPPEKVEQREEGVNSEDNRVTGELGAKRPAAERGSEGPPGQPGELSRPAQEEGQTDSRSQLPGPEAALSPSGKGSELPNPDQRQVTDTNGDGSGGTTVTKGATSENALNSGGASATGDRSTGSRAPAEPQVTSTTVLNTGGSGSMNNPTGTRLNHGGSAGNVLPSAPRVEELPSRASASLIHPLTPDETTIRPSVPQLAGAETTVRSQTKQVPINPLPNTSSTNATPPPTPNPVTLPTVLPSSPRAPDAAPNTPQATPNTSPPNTPPTTPANKDDGVKNVLMSVLRELERSLDEVNEIELSRPETPNKQSLCDVLNTTTTNICQTNSNPANAGNTGAPVNPELLGLVNRYYVNNACVTENSLNQLYNSGDFSYKLLSKHLAQFSKKAPNKTVQTVYDKSVPVVTKLTELFKDAETALVSDTVKKLLEKRYSVLTTALCGVANNQQDFLSSTELNNNHVTLSLNEEDFINQATKELMKAYEPMVELLREFNTLLPKLFELFEEGFENKINLVSSLAHVKPQESTASSGTRSGSGTGNTGVVPGGGGNAGPPAHALIQYVDDQDREIAAVHGHPSLIQRIKSLLQINSPADPAPTRPNEPAPARKQPPRREPGTSGQSRPSGPESTPVNGLRLLDRASPGGVNVDQHTPRTATSGLTPLPGPHAPSSPGTGNSGQGNVVPSPPAPSNPGAGLVSADAPGETDGSEGVFGGLKRRLKSLVSNSPGQPATKNVQHEIDDELLTAAYAQFEHLGLFKTKNGKLVPELDEQKVKTLVRSNLLSLNEFDSMYNLVIGPQRSMHGLYEFVEHLLLSPDADEKISALNDKKLMEQINKVVSPLEDLYEQVKSNSKDLRLRMPEIPVEETVTVRRTKRGATEHRPSTAGSSFQVVSNSSGVKVSQEGQLAKIKNLFKPLLGNGMTGSTWFLVVSSVLIILI